MNEQPTIYYLYAKMFIAKWFLYWSLFLDGIVGVLTLGFVDLKTTEMYKVWLEKFIPD